MSEEKYIEAIFPIKCCGRNEFKKPVFPENKAIDAKVTVYQPLGIDKRISSSVKCKYITGGHGQRCDDRP